MRRVAIIGAGASGLACLKELLNHGQMEIMLFDRNASIAKKIAATGNGHCNLSNTDIDASRYSGDYSFFEEIITSFDIVKFCHELGFLTRLKGSLYYPYSEQAKTVVSSFEKLLNHPQVELYLNTQIKGIKQTKDGYFLFDQNKKYYNCDAVVIAAGGKAGKGFGTDGAIFKVLEDLGIHSTPLYPSLVSLITKENVKKLKGCRVHGTFTLKQNNQIVQSYVGEVLFTDQGISGISCMQFSRFLDFSKNNQYTLHLNFVDHLSKDNLVNYYQQNQASYHGVVQDKIAEYLGYKTTSSFDDFYTRLSNLTFNIIGTLDFELAQVTKGGIDCSHITKDLMLKKYPHMYLCGEVLNVDGDCGGFNLHFAFATGTHVGKHISSLIDKELNK